VLLLTLGIIALAAMALAGFARQSLTMALDARLAHEEAQRRWGEASCRRILLDRAEELLARQVTLDQKGQPQLPAPSYLAATFKLGGLEFNVLLADENAKVNLNVILDRKPEQLQQLTQTLCANPNLHTPQLALRPSAPRDGAKPRFESWGQVYDFTSSSDSLTAIGGICEATLDATCWGDGKINATRANDLALRAVAGLVLNAQESGELLKARRQWKGSSTEDLLRQLDLRASKLNQLRRLLGDQSSCHSLWTRIEAPQRTWSTLAVSGGDTRGGPAVQTFVW
jgi:hypothetical protein